VVMVVCKTCLADMVSQACAQRMGKQKLFPCLLPL
jgi:hypothetical protein